MFRKKLPGPMQTFLHLLKRIGLEFPIQTEGNRSAYYQSSTATCSTRAAVVQPSGISPMIADVSRRPRVSAGWKSAADVVAPVNPRRVSHGELLAGG